MGSTTGNDHCLIILSPIIVPHPPFTALLQGMNIWPLDYASIYSSGLFGADAVLFQFPLAGICSASALSGPEQIILSVDLPVNPADFLTVFSS